MPEVCIRRPVLHPGQQRIADSPAKRKVLILGRRWGKTTFVADEAVGDFLAGRQVLYAAPQAEQTEVFWLAVCRSLAEATAAKAVYKNETRRLLRGKRAGWGEIQARTAHDADGLRSGHADKLILDEWPLMDPSAWAEVGAPMLLDNDGDAVFLGTPKRKNHAYAMFARGLPDRHGHYADERWRSFTGPSMENPHLSPQALADITSDLTEDMYRQEILAEFLENDGAVFRNVAACLWDGATVPADHEGHRMVAGVDWGDAEDFTAISVVCVSCRAEVELYRRRLTGYHAHRERAAELVSRWAVNPMLVELNSIGGPNFEELEREGLPVEGFTTSPTSKPPLVEGLVLALERGEYRWIDDPPATAELEAYERTVSPTTGRSSYGAPRGVHDDTVIARALALHASNQPVPRFVSLFD